MPNAPNQEYALVPSDAAQKTPSAEEPNLLPRTRWSLKAALAVASGLCFVGAALAVTATRSRSRSFLGPAVAQQLQQKVLVHNEVLAETVPLPVSVYDSRKFRPDLRSVKQPQILAMNTVDQGFYSGIEDAVSKAVTTSEEWEAFWGRHAATHFPPPAIPAIDFEKDMVLCAFLGTKSSGGWSIKIKSVERKADQLRVLCEFEQPKCQATMALTQPFHMVTVAKTDLPLNFVTTEAVPRVLTFIVTVKSDASDDKKRQVGEALKSLKGVSGTHSMFGGKIITVRFDAKEVDPAAAEKCLNSVDGLGSIEKDEFNVRPASKKNCEEGRKSSDSPGFGIGTKGL